MDRPAVTLHTFGEWFPECRALSLQKRNTAWQISSPSFSPPDIMLYRIGTVKRIVLFLLVLPVMSATGSGQSLYDPATVQKIEITFAQQNWDSMLDTAKEGSEGYLMAEKVVVNGQSFDSVGVKYKGNSSYSANRVKNPFHIKLDYIIDNQSCDGFEDIKLSNGFQDPSMIREALAYSLLKNYMHCSRSNFAEVYVNGSYMGLYTNTEDVNNQFLSAHFYSSDGVFVKCNLQMAGGGPGGSSGRSNLRYITGDSSRYFTRYELKSDYGWNDLVALCNTVTSDRASLDNVMNMDRAIWMLAFNNLAVNLDSYSGSFVQNYYLYKDNTGRYNTIIWDLNMCFASFTQTGSTALTNNTQKQQMSTTLHSNDADWPLIQAILNNPTYRNMYFAHMRTMNSELFASGLYKTIATEMQATISQSVQSDPNKFYTFARFQNGLTQDASSGGGGMGNVIGIANLMDKRSAWLAATPEFQYTQPSISAVQTVPAVPAAGATVSITAVVTDANASSVYLAYRFAATDKFTRIPMYDDGAHSDGAAGDNTYGADIVMQSHQAQYYMYAENDKAGRFSPERAEHEFYTLTAEVAATARPGDIIINEFLASNQTGITDEQGNHEDWIELYNTTSEPISLAGVYLSDDMAEPTKWAFPDTVSIPAHGYLLVWADEDTGDAGYHAGIKLSAAGEQIIVSYANGVVLDSLSFGTQTADVSMSRCPEAPDGFAGTSHTTPGAGNDCSATTGIAETEQKERLLLYPNPAGSHVHIALPLREMEQEIAVRTLTGDIICRVAATGSVILNTEAWPAGVYFISCGLLLEQLVKQ